MRRLGHAVAGFALLAAVGPLSARAVERGFVRGEIRLNLRTGPGTEFRILGAVTTGDAAEILQRGEGWTQVRLADGKQGWIPAGYLQPQPPPALRVSQLDAEVSELSAKLESTTSEAERLRTENTDLTALTAEQATEVERLGLEVLQLSAGVRWPEWITGAGILAVGMLLGAMFHRNATRRPSARIRI